MPDSSFNFGHFVSDFVHSIPPDPVTPQGLPVSSFVHDLHIHIPPDPISPGDFVSVFVHSLIPQEPVTPQCQLASHFVHELHHPTTKLIGVGEDHGFLITSRHTNRPRTELFVDRT